MSIFAFFFFLFFPGIAVAISPTFSGQMLSISPNGRYLRSNNTKIFLLSDSAWTIVPNTTRAETDTYIANRAAKGFTAIMFVPQFNMTDGFTSGDVAQPIESYWQEVDYRVAKARAAGLIIQFGAVWSTAMVPSEVTTGNAQAYGEFLGARYGSNGIIWLIGTDSNNFVGNETIYRNLAKGIAIGVSGSEDYSKVMMTYHPAGCYGSGQFVGNEVWLDFNSAQAGHKIDNDCAYSKVSDDYTNFPTKPIIDLEANYDNIPSGLVLGATKLTDWDVRHAAYWSVFSGSPGFGYGGAEIYPFWNAGEPTQPWGNGPIEWQAELDNPSASQMGYLKKLILAHNMRVMVADNSIILNDLQGGSATRRALVATDGTYALVYIGSGNAGDLQIDMSKLSAGGANAVCRWFNPVDGTYVAIGTFATSGSRLFTPADISDYVLVLEAQ